MLKKIVSLAVGASLIFIGTGSISLANTVTETYVLDLHEAMDMAVEYSQDIKDIQSQKVTLEETIRSGKSTKNQIEFMVENYEDFVDKWNDDDGKYDDYKDLTTSELQEKYIDLNMSLMRSSVYMNPEKMKQVNREIDFIKYIFMFGSDEPDLTSEEIYNKYEKNALLAEKQSIAGVKKTLNMIDKIEGNLEKGVLQLYDTIQTLENGIEISIENLELEKAINEDNKEMYNLGQISKVDLEVDNLELEKQNIEHEKILLQYDMANNSLKALLGLRPDDKLILTEEVEMSDFLDDIPLEEEIETAQQANTDLIGYRLDYDVIKANYDLYMEYSGRTFGNEYETLTDDLNDAKKNVRDMESKIEANVRFAYNDVLTKIQSFNTKKREKENAEASLIQTLEFHKQGLATRTQVSGSKLMYQSTLNGFKAAKRELQSSIMKYDILLEKGILYE